MVLELLPKLFHECNDRHCRRIAQRTERTSKHVLREVLNVIDIFLHASAGVESRQRLLEPISSFAARNAPSAAFMLIKLDGSKRKFHDTRGVVEYHHAARPPVSYTHLTLPTSDLV